MSEQGSPEWFAERCGMFTASEIHKLLIKGKSGDEFGESAVTYILEKIGEKLSGISSTSHDTAATLWGKEQEPLAREWYCRKHEMVCDEVGFVKHSILPNFGGSADGRAYKVGSGDEAGIIEIKCPYTYSAHLQHCLIEDQAYFKKYFTQYYWQMTANMMVNGLTWGDFISFDPRLNSKAGLFVMRITLDEADRDLLSGRIVAASILMDNLEKQISK